MKNHVWYLLYILDQNFENQITGVSRYSAREYLKITLTGMSPNFKAASKLLQQSFSKSKAMEVLKHNYTEQAQFEAYKNNI